MGERRSTLRSTAGGVMTIEAGTITGELELRTVSSAGTVEAKIRYVEAGEWYTVEGSPAATGLPEAECHERIVTLLTTPGEKRGFNEDPVSLAGEIS